jgi:signal transduction histidine kinase/CheY-like chemotaxis protein
MLKQPNNFVYKTVVIVWLTLSVGGIVLASLSWWQLSRQMSFGRQMATMRETLDATFKSMLDSETGVRGYVITGNKKFLQPYNESQTNLPALLNNLVQLTHEHPDLLRDVTDLRAQAELNQHYQDKVVQARNRSFAEAQTIVATGEGKQIMDQAREQVQELEDLHGELRSDLRNKIRDQLMQASLTSVVAASIGIAAGIFAFWLARLTAQHKERERELTEAKLRAERSNQEKTVFLANMSHEIRTPMNAILGFSELLQGALRDSKQREFVRVIRSSAESLLLLINDILDMSKIEAGVLELRPEPTDAREICELIRTLFSEPAIKKGIKLNFQVAENLPRAMLMDRIRLRQILVNLVGNAVKFTDKGSILINIYSEKQEHSSQITLIIEVEDTGLGIPRDKLDLIFNAFVQSGAHREKEKQGTGLGLSIVKRLTEMMGGTVTVASVMNKGSAFHLRFPDVPISARLSPSEKLPANGEVDFNMFRPSTLLVVDDNQTNCQLVQAIFSSTHHRVLFAFSGEDAVLRTREIKPDIVLLDIRMPGMDGREALAEIRKTQGLEMIPVIAVTASNLIDAEKTLKEKFSGYVRKPFSKRELFDELAEFLPPNAPPTDAQNDIITPALNNSIVVSPDLIAQLRQLLANPWPALRDSVAINEIKTFAQGLEGLGERWQCAPLTDYARNLLSDAQNYAVPELEKHLGEFPALIEQLSKNVSA